MDAFGEAFTGAAGVQRDRFDVAGCRIGRPGPPRMLTTWR